MSILTILDDFFYTAIMKTCYFFLFPTDLKDEEKDPNISLSPNEITKNVVDVIQKAIIDYRMENYFYVMIDSSYSQVVGFFVLNSAELEINHGHVSIGGYLFLEVDTDKCLFVYPTRLYGDHEKMVLCSNPYDLQVKVEQAVIDIMVDFFQGNILVCMS